jgi:hypothetical protein
MYIVSLNHYLLYVAEAINCHYVLFRINVQCIFLLFILQYKKYIIILSGKIIIIFFTPFIMSSYYS